jgi:hypothetical protein
LRSIFNSPLAAAAAVTALQSINVSQSYPVDYLPIFSDRSASGPIHRRGAFKRNKRAEAKR